MFYGNVSKIETTTDKETVNKLLADGWYLMDYMQAYKGEKGYLFFLAYCDEFRNKLFGIKTSNEER